MREIRFRAWDKELKLMAPLHVWDFRHPASERFIPMQYTGLKDKNGVEIYEGDILQLKNSKGHISNHQEVYWNEETASFDWRTANDDSWPDGFTGFIDEYEVIGNIYEHPELLGNK